MAIRSVAGGPAWGYHRVPYLRHATVGAALNPLDGSGLNKHAAFRYSRPVLVGEGQGWLEGEERAWGILATLSPQDVARRTGACYNASSHTFTLDMYGKPIHVSTEDRRMWGDSSVARFLLIEFHYYSRLSVLWYMVQARDMPLSGSLINPSHMRDGLLFRGGSHALPLDKVAGRYGDDAEAFVRRGLELGGERLDFGDASLRLFPFPRVPVVLVLWKNDQEFPARADLLFDSTCSAHLPTDILWSTAMISVLIMV